MYISGLIKLCAMPYQMNRWVSATPNERICACAVAGFGTLISRVINLLIRTYGWRGSLIFLGGICIQLLVLASLIRPLYAKRVKKKPTMSELEEVIPKITDNEHTTAKNKDAINAFSSHDGITQARRPSVAMLSVTTTRRTFSSHMHISQVNHPHHDAALKHRTGDLKLNPYNREDIFFSGSTYDIEKIQGKSGRSIENFASQITIDSIPVEPTGCAKIKSNLKKNFNLRIFKSLTFCLVVMAMTLHHMAFFVPYTYIISLTKEKGIDTSESEYLIICFGKQLLDLHVDARPATGLFSSTRGRPDTIIGPTLLCAFLLVA